MIIIVSFLGKIERQTIIIMIYGLRMLLTCDIG